jgi:hypothetical protein
MFIDKPNKTIIIAEMNLAKSKTKPKKVIKVVFQMDNGLDCTFYISASLSRKNNPVLHMRTIKRKTNERKTRSLMGIAVDEAVLPPESPPEKPVEKSGRKKKGNKATVV